MAHRPIYVWHDDSYTDGDKPTHQPAKIQAAFEKIFHDAGVDLFIAGHTHMYQRTFPVFNSTTQAHNYTNPRGMVTLVAGAAGSVEGLTAFNVAAAKPTWFAFGYNRTEGFGLLDVDHTSVTWKYYSAPANSTSAPVLIDQMVITK